MKENFRELVETWDFAEKTVDRFLVSLTVHGAFKPLLQTFTDKHKAAKVSRYTVYNIQVRLTVFRNIIIILYNATM